MIPAPAKLFVSLLADGFEERILLVRIQLARILVPALLDVNRLE